MVGQLSIFYVHLSPNCVLHLFFQMENILTLLFGLFLLKHSWNKSQINSILV